MDRNIDWTKHEDVARWVDEWRTDPSHRYLEFAGQHDPLDELQLRIDRGDFQGRNLKSVQSFLRAAKAAEYRLSDAGRADREERMARAAERSARWAGFAILISLAALAVAARPYW